MELAPTSGWEVVILDPSVMEWTTLFRGCVHDCKQWVANHGSSDLLIRSYDDDDRDPSLVVWLT